MAGDQGGGLVNVLIANNTFVNSTTEAGVVINQGTHQNSRFIDNLTVQDGTLPVASISTNAGLTVSNNLWSKNAQWGSQGNGRRGGGSPVGQSGVGLHARIGTGCWTGSPAIDKATLLPEVTQDYAGAARGAAPDLGAFEK